MKIQVNTYMFEDDGKIPNNPTLPVLHYIGVLSNHPDQIESVFNRNGWLNSWQDGVFPHHHYHSNSHEVLGVISGSVILQLGGELGSEIELNTGDVVVLPAGTGHKKISSSEDFIIVGGYPDGMEYNTRWGEPCERPEVLEEIRQVPIPSSDPVYGTDGPLLREWQ